jgi:DNA-binding transcriptional ArsR family regulator
MLSKKSIIYVISSEADESEREQLSHDLIFDLLSNPRRRFILYYLRTKSGSVKLSELTGEIAAWEYETPIDELTDQEQKRVYVSLYQTHVPKLVEAGLVDYDTEEKALQPTNQICTIDDYLPSDDDRDSRWELAYLSLSTIGVIILAIGISNASVFGVVSVAVAGAIILVLFSSMAIIHFLSIRRHEQQLPIELSDIETK